MLLRDGAGRELLWSNCAHHQVLASPFAFKGIQRQHMIKLVSRYDRADGAENLLVLDGKNGYAWNIGAFIKYLQDGSINIKCIPERKFWWPIAELELKSGSYSFPDLSNVDSNTVGLVIETNNSRYTPDGDQLIKSCLG